jgi:DNA-directed RNA polymerase subunit M/transcription elongation factor TFIIS
MLGRGKSHGDIAALGSLALEIATETFEYFLSIMKDMVEPVIRYRFFKELTTYISKEGCIEIEMETNALFQSETNYVEKVKQILHNLILNPSLKHHGIDLIYLSDSQMARGTMLQKAEEHEAKRELMLQTILKEKSGDSDMATCDGPLRCRTCGSSSVAWDQKQTRSADEASTVRHPANCHTFKITCYDTYPFFYTGILCLHEL